MKWLLKSNLLGSHGTRFVDQTKGLSFFSENPVHESLSGLVFSKLLCNGMNVLFVSPVCKRSKISGHFGPTLRDVQLYIR